MTDLQRWTQIVDDLNQRDKVALEIMSLGDGFSAKGTLIAYSSGARHYYIPHSAPMTQDLLDELQATEDNDAKLKLLLDSGVLVQTGTPQST